MNVKIANKYDALLNNLDIDIIKSIQGVFTPEEIVMQFNNFFYNKMIIDITAISDYQNISQIQDLSINLDMSKVVILLDDSKEVNSPKYLAALVSMGIYNFTREINTVKFLIDNPNSYKDVAHYQQMSEDYEEYSSDDSEQSTDFNNESYVYPPADVRVIGIKNVTDHAGSTTLTYLLKKQLEKKYNVVAVEVDENDFIYLNDKSLRRTTHVNLQQFLTNHSNADVILVDLNEKGNVALCNDVLYLIEPGLIKLNKLIRKDSMIFEKLKGKKIILNCSILDNNDIGDFEFESHSKIYFNIPYLDDKLDNYQVLEELLIQLGFSALTENGKGNKIFNIFK